MTSRTRRTITATALVAAVGVLPLSACSGIKTPDFYASTTPTATATATATTTETATASPSAAGGTELAEGDVSQEQLSGKIGQDVIFMAEVAELISPDALTVGGQEAGQEPALVVGADIPSNVEVGDTIQVRGTVEDFDIAAVEGEVDVDLDDAAFASYEGSPAIVAATAERQ